MQVDVTADKSYRLFVDTMLKYEVKMGDSKRAKVPAT